MNVAPLMLFYFCLVGYSRSFLCCFLRIAKIIVLDRLQILVQFIDKRQTSWDVQFRDLSIGNMIEIFHHGADTISVRGDDHAPAGFDRWRQGRMPVWQHAIKGKLERLGGWQLFRSQRGIPRVEARMTLIIKFQRRRWYVIAPSPDL